MLRPILLVSLLASPLALGAGKGKSTSPAAINVTGTWNTNFAGSMDLLLHQEGNLVWGKDNTGYIVRGDWSEGRLTLFYRADFKPGQGSCSAPLVAVVRSKGTATRMEGVEFPASGDTVTRTLTRASPNPGEDFSYPYGEELKVCGSLPAHDLVFESASSKLVGKEWPLLAAVAEMLQKNTEMKIQILGHTDSTGDAEKNKDLSDKRAASVKEVLVTKYKADSARIATKGWGSEQPLASNDTDEGRAVNRRVEILVVR
jgi:outer membrane protein OmpA-like peptidoglycan-associated protein